MKIRKLFSKLMKASEQSSIINNTAILLRKDLKRFMSSTQAEDSSIQEVQEKVESLSLEQPVQQQKPTQQLQPSQEQQTKPEQKKQEDEEFEEVEPETAHFVNVNRQVIQFGKTTLYPGSIEEVDVCIDLTDNVLSEVPPGHSFLLRVIAKCNDEEFNDLDEYVFSVRSNQRFEYFEEVRFKIRAKQRAQVKIAVKVPPVKENHKINGVLEIQLENTRPLCLPIHLNCQVPEVTCLKKLFKVDENAWMIKIPAKKNQIRMPPIPFKNLSNFNFTLQVEAITNENFSKRPYDIIVQNFVNCQANTQFFVNLQLKQNMNYQGPMPTKDTIRKILVLKIKNSSIYFNFPMEIQVFESSNNSPMS